MARQGIPKLRPIGFLNEANGLDSPSVEGIMPSFQHL